MNRDKVVASAIGFTLGIVVAIILWRGPQFFFNGSPEIAPNLSAPITDKEITPLTLNAPTDGSIAESEIIKVEGKAEEADLMVITSPIDESVTTVDEDDSFAVSIELEEGENEITVTEYDMAGTIVDTKQIAVTFTSDSL